MVKKPIVLLIEPDEFLADIYDKNLTMNGFKVFLAKTGEKGIALAETKKPDLILLEIMLGATNGFELLSRMKGHRSIKDIPIIVITKLGQKQDVEKVFSLGATDYIIKTHFSPSELVDKIKRILVNKTQV